MCSPICISKLNCVKLKNIGTFVNSQNFTNPEAPCADRDLISLRYGDLGKIAPPTLPFPPSLCPQPPPLM